MHLDIHPEAYDQLIRYSICGLSEEPHDDRFLIRL